MPEDKPKPPTPGDVVDGYRYIGGDPSEQANWMSAAAPVPSPQMETSLPGKAYAVGKGALGVVKDIAPAAAAGAAGLAYPPASPVTAPLAYAATQGLINPQEVKEHPITEAIAAGTMALPGPAEAVHYAFPRFAVEHPGLMRAGGALLGGVAGGMLGNKSGVGNYGELGGGIGGAFLGYRLGGAEATEAGKRLVEDVLLGKRPVSELPPRLMRNYLTQAKAIADQAMQAGETIDMVQVPVGARKVMEKMQEDRARMVPETPPSIISPEDYESSLSRLKASKSGFDPLAEETRSAASARGMAHAAGKHSLEFVPAKKGVTITQGKTYSVRPRLPIVKE